VKRTPIISLGAGVQSSVLLLMAARGDLEGHGFEAPALAVFADTQQEPPAVYEWLAFLRMQAYTSGVELAQTTAGDLFEAAISGSFNPIPMYRRNDDGTVSVGRRQCTYQFKSRPLRALLRRRGFGPGNPVETWMGITVDEAERMKPSGKQWAENRWPLIELGMTRGACKRWLHDHGYPEPPKSSCTFCPYKSARDFARMREEDPESFEAACRMDEAMRYTPEGAEQFVLRTCVPLRELRTAEDEGQLGLELMDECEGGCFV
jgi:hypothetical protein